MPTTVNVTFSHSKFTACLPFSAQIYSILRTSAPRIRITIPRQARAELGRWLVVRIVKVVSRRQLSVHTYSSSSYPPASKFSTLEKVDKSIVIINGSTVQTSSHFCRIFFNHVTSHFKSQEANTQVPWESSVLAFCPKDRDTYQRL